MAEHASHCKHLTAYISLPSTHFWACTDARRVVQGEDVRGVCGVHMHTDTRVPDAVVLDQAVGRVPPHCDAAVVANHIPTDHDQVI
jgi:hypothetical protein